KVTLLIKNLGVTSDDLTVQVRVDAGGSPGVVLVANTHNDPNPSDHFADFPMPPGLTLQANTPYYLAAFNFQTSFEGYWWKTDAELDGSPPTYYDGQAFSSNSQGDSWSGIAAADLLFQVWGIPSTC